MIPLQKHEVLAMDFVTKNEFHAMFGTYDTKTHLGARDKLMLMMVYNSGTEYLSYCPLGVLT